jgi:hypothetical protein
MNICLVRLSKRVTGQAMLFLGSSRMPTSPSRSSGEIASILKEHDVPIRVLKAKMPGRSYYEDDYQIVVLAKKGLRRI